MENFFFCTDWGLLWSIHCLQVVSSLKWKCFKMGHWKTCKTELSESQNTEQSGRICSCLKQGCVSALRQHNPHGVGQHPLQACTLLQAPQEPILGTGDQQGWSTANSAHAAVRSCASIAWIISAKGACEYVQLMHPSRWTPLILRLCKCMRQMWQAV